MTIIIRINPIEAPKPTEVFRMSSRDLFFNLELLKTYLRLIKMPNIKSMGTNPTISAARIMPLRKKYITNIKPPIDKMLRVVLLIIAIQQPK